jgi:KUP system potassium uptake protein
VAEQQRAQGRGHLALLSLGALGVVYGDIGTSPLYAFREAIRATGGVAVDRVAVLGILSLVCWSLIVVVTAKYLAVVMRADNHGEASSRWQRCSCRETPPPRAVGGS